VYQQVGFSTISIHHFNFLKSLLHCWSTHNLMYHYIYTILMLLLQGFIFVSFEAISHSLTSTVMPASEKLHLLVWCNSSLQTVPIIVNHGKFLFLQCNCWNQSNHNHPILMFTDGGQQCVCIRVPKIPTLTLYMWCLHIATIHYHMSWHNRVCLHIQLIHENILQQVFLINTNWITN